MSIDARGRGVPNPCNDGAPKACNDGAPSSSTCQRAARPSSTQLWLLLESRLGTTILASPPMMMRGTRRRTNGMRKCEMHLATMSCLRQASVNVARNGRRLSRRRPRFAKSFPRIRHSHIHATRWMMGPRGMRGGHSSVVSTRHLSGKERQLISALCSCTRCSASRLRFALCLRSAIVRLRSAMQ